MAEYIDTGSEEPRSQKQQPKVALASGAIAYEKTIRPSLASQTVIAQHPGKQLVPDTYAARAPCWQSCFNGLWVRGEYLHWWTDAMDTPPLVTTSPAGTAPAVAGILGQPGTETLLGNGDLGGSGQSGARISFGWWLDPSTCRGIEANYFGLARRTSSFTANSASTPILARPVFDTGTNAEAAMLVAHPDFLTGSINVQAATEMQGAEALFRRRVYEGCDTRLDFLFGYRFARLDESLSISQSSEWTSAQGQIVVGTTKSLFDSLATDNQFHGGEIGFTYAQQLNCWSMDATMKLGLGNNHSVVVIDGQTVTTVPNGGSATFVGGLLAQQTNIGRFERDAFGFIPELAVTLRRDLGCNWQFSVGYNLMYWTATLRPGDQIDHQVSQFPPEAPTGTRQPEFDFQSRGFLVQGLQLGLEYKF
ncbi:MAG: BBP7 family outer membrane beta-barrel protein [Planctomycetota bacterium]